MQWEYKVEENFYTIGRWKESDYLNTMGKLGWELVSVLEPPGPGIPVTYY